MLITLDNPINLMQRGDEGSSVFGGFCAWERIRHLGKHICLISF